MVQEAVPMVQETRQQRGGPKDGLPCVTASLAQDFAKGRKKKVCFLRFLFLVFLVFHTPPLLSVFLLSVFFSPTPPLVFRHVADAPGDSVQPLVF